MTSDKAFVTWTQGGTKFLAFPFSSGVTVIDEDGNNFGSWMTIENFKKHPTARREPLGKLRLSLVFLEGRKAT